MENKPQNVFDRLDLIEASQSVIQAQNEQILDLLNKLRANVKQKVKVKQEPRVSNQEFLREFIKKSKKEYIWFISINEFNKSKNDSKHVMRCFNNSWIIIHNFYKYCIQDVLNIYSIREYLVNLCMYDVFTFSKCKKENV